MPATTAPGWRTPVGKTRIPTASGEAREQATRIFRTTLDGRIQSVFSEGTDLQTHLTDENKITLANGDGSGQAVFLDGLPGVSGIAVGGGTPP